MLSNSGGIKEGKVGFLRKLARSKLYFYITIGSNVICSILTIVLCLLGMSLGLLFMLLNLILVLVITFLPNFLEKKRYPREKHKITVLQILVLVGTFLISIIIAYMGLLIVISTNTDSTIAAVFELILNKDNTLDNDEDDEWGYGDYVYGWVDGNGSAVGCSIKGVPGLQIQ